MSGIAVTGAGGFIGRRLVSDLAANSREPVIAISRNPLDYPEPAAETHSWRDALNASVSPHPFTGCECVIHLAGRAHVMNDKADDVLAAYRKVNVERTVELANLAIKAGVRRFIFVSSIKVNGERTEPGRPFRADDVPQPEDPYGISKLEAEEALLKISEQTGLEVVIIRPVLVYGPGVKANFRRMMTWVGKGTPLPFGCVRNQRSFVALDNLISLIEHCIDHPAAAGQVFLVSDGEALSTPQLLEKIGVALERPARLLPFPPCLLMALAALLGKRAMAERVMGSLLVDISKTQERLGWTPPMSVSEALRLTAMDFRQDDQDVGAGGGR